MSKKSYFEHGWSHSLVSQQTDSNSFEISEQCLVNSRMDPNLSSLEIQKLIIFEILGNRQRKPCLQK